MIISALSFIWASMRICCPARSRAAPGWRGSRQELAPELQVQLAPELGDALLMAGTGASDIDRCQSPVWPCPHSSMKKFDLFFNISYFTRRGWDRQGFQGKEFCRTFPPDFVEKSGWYLGIFCDKIKILTSEQGISICPGGRPAPVRRGICIKSHSQGEWLSMSNQRYLPPNPPGSLCRADLTF